MRASPLSAEQVQQILGTLGADVGPENRSARRRELDAPMRIAPVRGDETGAALDVSVRDFSGTGIGFVYGERVEVGQLFLIPPTGPEGRGIAVMFKVVYCTPAEGGGYRVGGKFTNVFPQYEGAMEVAV